MVLVVRGLNIARAIRRKLPFLPRTQDLDGVITAEALYFGTPSIGTTSLFGSSQICVAWAHDFAAAHIALLNAIIEAEGQEQNFSWQETLPEDWTV